MKTKNYLSLFLLLAFAPFLQAQWSTDPANPGVVCDAAGIQSDPQSFADDNGGLYVFWLDHRNGTTQDARDVYGQHFDSDGYALWEEDGRMILQHANKIYWFNVSRLFNDEIIIGWVTHADGEFGDSLKIQRLDNDGLKVWPADLLVSNTGFQPNAILGLSGYHIIHDNAGYCITIQTIYYGGSTRNRITRFTSNGGLTGPYSGEPEGYAYGSSGLRPAFDAGNSVYLYYSSGNGSGANLFCLKLSLAGDTIWGPVNVLTGTAGLNYQFSGISDENGITFVWQGNGSGGSNTNIYARRLNTDGTFAWNGNSLAICTADGEQSRFYLKKNEDNYYITWADGRPGVSPGNYDIYAQKFDMNGNYLWAENGIEVISLNTYIPYPEFDFSDNNSMIICHQAVNIGFIAQKVLDDGTVVWDAEGSLICIPTYSPFYSEHVEVQAGDKTIAVWAKTNPGGGSDNIYITRVDDNPSTGVYESHPEKIRIFPNPAADMITLVLPENLKESSISIFDSYGKEVFRTENFLNYNTGSFKISTSKLPTGLYIVEVKSGNKIYSEKFMVK